MRAILNTTLMPTVRGASERDEDARELEVLARGSDVVLRLRPPAYGGKRAPMDAVCSVEDLIRAVNASPYEVIRARSERRGAPRIVTIGRHKRRPGCTYVWIRAANTVKPVNDAGWDFFGPTALIRAALTTSESVSG